MLAQRGHSTLWQFMRWYFLTSFCMLSIAFFSRLVCGVRSFYTELPIGLRRGKDLCFFMFASSSAFSNFIVPSTTICLSKQVLVQGTSLFRQAV